MMRSHICDANEDYFNFLESDIYLADDMSLEEASRFSGVPLSELFEQRDEAIRYRESEEF